MPKKGIRFLLLEDGLVGTIQAAKYCCVNYAYYNNGKLEPTGLSASGVADSKMTVEEFNRRNPFSRKVVGFLTPEMAVAILNCDTILTDA